MTDMYVGGNCGASWQMLPTTRSLAIQTVTLQRPEALSCPSRLGSSELSLALAIMRHFFCIWACEGRGR